MAIVTAKAPCFFHHKIMAPGEKFSYEGPPQPFLELVEGDWVYSEAERKALDAVKLKEKHDQNEALRQELAMIEAEKENQRLQAAIAAAKAPPSPPAGTETAEPPKKGDAKKT